MIKYFDELNNLNNYQIYVMKYNRFNHISRKVPDVFYKKYWQLFSYIKDINNLLELKMIREIYNINDSNERRLKIISIINIIKNKYMANKDEYEANFELSYLLMDSKYQYILKLLAKVNDLTTNELKSIMFFYKNFIEIVNPYQNKEIINTFDLAYKELSHWEEITYNMEYHPTILPNYWYILPRFHDIDERLYNTTGENGHKEANLIYSYNNALNGKLLNPIDFLNKIKDILKNGVCLSDYLSYVRYGGMGYFPNLLNDNIEEYNVRSHISNNINVSIGCIMAQGLLWEYFNNLHKKTSNYQEALKTLNSVILDDFLVRFVGFHKILIMNDEKIISTSNFDYEKEFSEYVRNGWHIDFTNPLSINYNNNQIEEFDDSFVKLKQFHVD